LFKQSLFCGFILKEAQKKKGGTKIVKDGSQKIRGGNPTQTSPERGGKVYIPSCQEGKKGRFPSSGNPSQPSPERGGDGGNPTLPSPERGGEKATKTNCSVITNSFNSIPSLFKKEGGIRRRLFK
jgi:hypothetical protein